MAVLLVGLCSINAENVVDLTDSNFDSELENMGTALGKEPLKCLDGSYGK